MSKPRSLNFKNYAAMLVIIALVISVTGYLIITRVHNFYYEQMENESHRLANSYAKNLENAVVSKEMINGLLNDKLLTAGKLAANFNENSGDLISKLAANLDIDEIYTYNANGEITYSYSGKYIGWKAYEGHPVYKFMQSGEQSYVDDIRKDSESGIYYKYGYFRKPDGSFIQIGVLADKVQKFIGSFEMQKMLDEMQNDQYVTNICFLDNNLKVLAGSDDNIVNISKYHEEAKNAIKSNKDYKNIVKINGVKLYQIMIPVFVKGEKFGTLIMTHDVKSTETIIRFLNYTASIALLVIYALLFISILLSYNKNKKLSNYAYFDILTRLPNTRYFEEKINTEKSTVQDKKAILLINYKKFKLINTTFGHHYGEKIIKDLSKRLTKLCCDDRRLFHISNDRFVLYVKKYRDKNDLAQICKKIIEMQKESIKTKTIGGNIGIVEMDDYKVKADILLKYASIAANNVGDEEPFGYCFFNEKMEDKLKREEDIEAELSKVVEEVEGANFYMLYQPILNLKTDRIYGFEALARLSSEKLGFVSPTEFIPIAEATHLIVPLGKIALRLACQFLKKLEANDFNDIKVTVNISAIQLHRDDFLPELMRIIEESQIKAANLGIEITESIFSNNYEMFNEKLGILKQLGMSVAIDDFGTGYSSLARERELNVNCLKIDKSFIDKLVSIGSDEALTGDIISMAHKLGDIVIAEGVELEEQKEYLIQNDCDCMQGFLFSKPIPQTAALAILEKQNVKGAVS